MAAVDNSDRRLQDRDLRAGRKTQEQVNQDVLSLPDSAENTEQVTDEELASLRDELIAEKPARDERIQRFINEPEPIIVPFEPPAPLDDEL